MPRLFQIMMINLTMFFAGHAISGVVALSPSECATYCHSGVCNKDADGFYKCNIIKK